MRDDLINFEYITFLFFIIITRIVDFKRAIFVDIFLLLIRGNCETTRKLQRVNINKLNIDTQ